MRCPYCGGLNSDQAAFCARCGRDLSVQRASQPPRPPQRPPLQQPVQRPPVQRPVQVPNYAPPQQRIPPIPQPAPGAPPYVRKAATRYQDVVGFTESVALVGPDAPAPFPPHTLQHLHLLEQGGLEYEVLSEEVVSGNKKIVRIYYPACLPWQQVGTLLNAYKRYKAETFTTLIVQGVHNKDDSVYSFTNGQLVFDRDTRLGSQILDRYQIETGSGFESDAVRIVLTE